VVCGLWFGPLGVDEVQGVDFRVKDLELGSKGFEVMVNTKSRV